MATDIAEIVVGKVDLRIADARLDSLRSRQPKIPDGEWSKELREEVKLYLGECLETRQELDDSKEQLKRPVLEYGRAIDREYNRIKAAIEEIEGPIRAAKKKVDDEAARIKREAEEAERRKFEEAERQRKESEAAELKRQQDALAAQQAELDRQREEQEAKAAELKRLQDQLEEQQREADRKEQEAQDRAEWEKKAQARAEKEAAEKLARDQEAARLAEERRKERERLELEAAPDIEKLSHYAAALRSVEVPSVRGLQAMRVAFNAQQLIKEATELLLDYQGEFGAEV